jgi:putative transposase
MPRKLRIEYEDAIYHLMNRGDHRDNIFHNDKDRELFLKTLGEVCERTGWQIHAYGLMRNHFHLVVETPRPNLSLGMQWLLGIYTARFKPPAQTLRPPVQRPATSIRSGLNCSNRTTRPKASA